MTKYKCNQCGASDSDRTTSPPVALICHECRAGFGKSIKQQIEERDGMFVVDSEGKFAWEK